MKELTLRGKVTSPGSHRAEVQSHVCWTPKSVFIPLHNMGSYQRPTDPPAPVLVLSAPRFSLIHQHPYHQPDLLTEVPPACLRSPCSAPGMHCSAKSYLDAWAQHDFPCTHAVLGLLTPPSSELLQPVSCPSLWAPSLSSLTASTT